MIPSGRRYRSGLSHAACGLPTVVSRDAASLEPSDPSQPRRFKNAPEQPREPAIGPAHPQIGDCFRSVASRQWSAG